MRFAGECDFRFDRSTADLELNPLNEDTGERLTSIPSRDVVKSLRTGHWDGSREQGELR